MSIHRISDVSKGRDETYRRKFYSKRLSGAKQVTSDSLDTYDIREASALFNRYSAESTMDIFGDINMELNKIVNDLSLGKVSLSEVVRDYPSAAVIQLSKSSDD